MLEQDGRGEVCAESGCRLDLDETSLVRSNWHGLSRLKMGTTVWNHFCKTRSLCFYTRWKNNLKAANSGMGCTLFVSAPQESAPHLGRERYPHSRVSSTNERLQGILFSISYASRNITYANWFPFWDLKSSYQSRYSLVLRSPTYKISKLFCRTTDLEQTAKKTEKKPFKKYNRRQVTKIVPREPRIFLL